MVWKVWQGLRYFGGKPEVEIMRFKRMMENRLIMANLGLGVEIEKPLSGYTTEQWNKEVQNNADFEAAMKRYESGLEELEEEAEFDPCGEVNGQDSSEVEALLLSSSSHQESEISGSKKSRKQAPKLSVEIKSELIDFEQPGPSTSHVGNSDSSDLNLSELEMMLHNNSQSDGILEDLIVYKDLTRHVISAPISLPELLTDYPEITDDILLSEVFFPHERFIKMFFKRNKGGFDSFLKSYRSGTEHEEFSLPIFNPRDESSDSTILLDEEVRCNTHKRCRNSEQCREDKAKLLNDAQELRENFNRIDADEYTRKMDAILNDLGRIEISDDENEDEAPKSKRLKEQALKFEKALLSSLGKDHGVVSNDLITDNRMIEDDEQTDDVTLSDSGGAEAITPSFDKPVFKPRPQGNDEGATRGQLDDFDFLGTLDDSYLLSLFNDDDKAHSTDPLIDGHEGSQGQLCASGDSDATATTRRSNPPRIAKIGVEYSEIDDDFDDIDSFYCWKCEIIVTNTCDLHGPLLPCTELVTNRGTKNPDKFPTPSFVEIRESGIPGAGKGVFATKFIRPGQIIGEYKGKKVTEKEYKKLEKAEKESGYAWKTYTRDGQPLYIDGANYHSSNWLRFVNCARGKCEENVMVRTAQGKVEYYTFKPVAIGTELLVYYGNEYFSELGYLIDEKEPELGKFHCQKCYKLFNTDTEFQHHKCGTKRQWDPNNEKKFKCDVCGKLFGNSANLRQHIRTVHEKIKRLSCPYCHYRTDYSANMNRHMATHSGEKMFRCTHCDYAGTSKRNLTVHINTHHTNKVYRCRYKTCGEKRGSQEELYEHIRSDHPVQRYQCDTCPMSFSQLHYITRHKLTHNRENSPHICQYCNKRFTRLQNLTRHYRTHTGDEPYQCNICLRKFNDASNLNMHMYIHTGEKSHSCSYCGKNFTQSGTKSIHEMTCKYK